MGNDENKGPSAPFQGNANDPEPIAIIGMGCRLPPAVESPDDFWEFMLSGGNAVSAVPPDRWGKRYFHTDRARPGRSYCNCGAFLSDIVGFDAVLFGMTPREAEWMDPQQRLLLEVAWRAFEDAGQPLDRIAGSDTAVFVGAGGSDFMVRRSRHIDNVGPYAMTGAAASIVANRVSYCFDLRGPSMTIDTACSSGLVALHEAVQVVQRGLSRMALVGAVNVLLEPFSTVGFAKAGMLSPSGRCHSFDARADGYVRGEGAVALLLKRKSDAEADGDRIHALILGSAINSDGHTQGIALPNQFAQEEVLRQAYERAKTPLDWVSYVEAHGTGTPVGDPIECRSIGAVLGRARPAGSPLAIGSIKTQTGHLEFAAGLVGLLKATLILKNRAVPATLDFVTPNPEIPFDNLNLRVVDRLSPLGSESGRGVVGVNSFGFGGANAHVVLAASEPAEAAKTGSEEGGLTLLISARTEASLDAAAQAWAEKLAAPSSASWADLCWTANHRRSRHSHRLAVHAADAAEAAERLAAFLRKESEDGIVRGSAPAAPRPVALVFSGNGSQWLGMGADLYRDDAPSRKIIDGIADALRELGGVDILPVFAGGAGADSLAATDLAQPALFALQVAIVNWLRSRGMEFSSVVGHSVGELPAAYFAGALSFDDAIRVLHVRSRAQHRTAGRGKMLVAQLSPEEASRRIAPLFGAVSLAAVNAPQSVTLSGEPRAVDAIAATLEAEGVSLRRLDLDYGFHSPAMDAVEAEVRADLTDISPRPPKKSFVSTVTGTALAGEDLDAAYWWRNIREPVLFADAIAALTEAGTSLFLEIGPAPVLSGNVRECLRAPAATIAVAPTLRRDRPAIPELWRTLGQLCVLGAQFDLDRLPPQAGSIVDLPPYSWDRRRHWVDDQPGAAGASDHPEPVHPLLGDRQRTAQPTWHGAVDTGLFPFLADHRVLGVALLPAAAYVELCVAAAREVAPGDPVALEALTLRSGLPVDGATVLVETAYEPEDGVIAIRSKPMLDDGGWVLHAQARLRRAGSPGRPLDVGAALARCQERLDSDAFYRRCAERGFAYGPKFQTVESVWIGRDEALCRLASSVSKVVDDEDWILSPALADACLQLIMVLSPGDNGADLSQTLLPVGVEHIRCAPGSAPVFCHVAFRREARPPRIDGVVADASGTALLELRGIELQAVPRASNADAVTEVYRQNLALLDPPLQASPRSRLQPLHPSELLRRCAPTLARLKAELERLAVSGDWLTKFNALCDAWAMRAQGDNEVSPSVPPPDPTELWRDLLAAAPDRLAELFVAARLGEQLPRLVAGDVGAAGLLAGGTARSMWEALCDLEPVSRCWTAALVAILDEAASARPDGAFRVLLSGDAPLGLATALQARVSSPRGTWSVTLRSQLGAEDQNRAIFDVLVVIRAAEEDWLEPSGVWLRDGGLLVVFERRFGALERLAPDGFPSSDGRVVQANPRLRWTPSKISALQGFTEFEIVADPSGLDSGSLALASRKDPTAIAASVTSSALWLLVVDDEGRGVGASVAERLSASGQVVAVARLGKQFRRLDDRSYEVDPERPEDFHSLCRALADSGLEAEQVVFMCGLRPDEPAAPSPLRDLAALHLVQALRLVPWLAAPRLTLVAAGAHAADGGAPRPSQTPLWGIGRVVMSELPELHTRLIDFTPGEDSPIESLMSELLWPCEEEEVVISGPERYGVRIGKQPDEVLTAPQGRGIEGEAAALRLVMGRPGALDSLHFVESGAAKTLAPTEVAIRIAAAGLNFRDVAWALKLLPDEAVAHGLFGPSFGLECAGWVTAVGEAVHDLRPGDRVVAMGPACLATHVTQDAAWVHPLPDGMSFEEAATLPVALTTALYALDDAGRLRPGETILVHAAAGGVGLAAIRLAFARGATVLATAGSPEKRDFLKRLGVAAVFDSRSAGFVEDVLTHTDGAGVDVVLNSLSGEALNASLGLLKPFGRFVEIGKRDLYSDRRVGLRALRRHGSFHAVDMDLLMRDRPDEARRISKTLRDLLNAGGARGLPFREYPFARVVDAFRAMQRGAHIGKIVLSADSPTPYSRPVVRSKLRIDRAGSILVTGGFAGFGLATARWLAEKGAKRLILVGRSGPTPESAAVCATLHQSGVAVEEERVDVADYGALAEVFARAAARQAPITGVIHAAAVYADASVAKLDRHSFDRVMRPKALGAWNLHRLTADSKLDFFVLYASASSATGNGGQANYVAANSYLEALAAWRNAHGLPALAVAWGPIGDVGYLARNEAVRTELTARWGVTPLTAETALGILERLIVDGAKGTSIVAPAGWSKALQAAAGRERTRYRGLGPADAGETAFTLAGPLSDWPRWTAKERQDAVEALMVEAIGEVLRLELKQIQPEEPLGSYGIDSLMAVELALSIETRLGVELRALELANSSLRSVASRLVERLERKFSAAPDPIVKAAPDRTVKDDPGPEKSGFER